MTNCIRFINLVVHQFRETGRFNWTGNCYIKRSSVLPNVWFKLTTQCNRNCYKQTALFSIIECGMPTHDSHRLTVLEQKQIWPPYRCSRKKPSIRMSTSYMLHSHWWFGCINMILRNQCYKRVNFRESPSVLEPAVPKTAMIFIFV